MPVLPKSTLHQQIVNTLGERIIVGEYQEGELLPTEVDIAEQFGASRTATREALKILNSKGLITSRARVGTVVQSRDCWNLLDPKVLQWSLEYSPDRDQVIADFYELRMGFEPEACALAAARHDSEVEQELRRAIRTMANYSDQNDQVESDVQFHLTILHATHNPFYITLGNLISVGLRAIFKEGIAAIDNEDDILWIEKHKAVYLEIEAGNAEMARQKMQQLLLEGAQNSRIK